MINSAHLHLILNHIPVIGTGIAIFVLIMGLLMKTDNVKKVSLMILVLTALITIPVYISGNDAEAMIEGNYEDVDELFIDSHEEFALYSFIAMDIAGFIALLGLLWYRNPKLLPGYFVVLMMIILFIVNGMMAYTAALGGRIHHPEIREDKFPWEETVIMENTEKDDKEELEKEDSENEDKDIPEKEDEEDLEVEGKNKGRNRGKGGDKN